MLLEKYKNEHVTTESQEKEEEELEVETITENKEGK